MEKVLVFLKSEGPTRRIRAVCEPLREEGQLDICQWAKPEPGTNNESTRKSVVGDGVRLQAPGTRCV